VAEPRLRRVHPLPATNSAPAAQVARKIEGRLAFAFGSTMATSKKHLVKIGSWETMANHHSDDFELGNRIAESGHRVALMTTPSLDGPSERLP